MSPSARLARVLRRLWPALAREIAVQFPVVVVPFDVSRVRVTCVGGGGGSGTAGGKGGTFAAGDLIEARWGQGAGGAAVTWGAPTPQAGRTAEW